uniref:Nudix hydrolase domain-containing protein n=1 Tax=Oryza brachyantha TaxID=4533 RepID=J3MSM0_ORYBR
MAGGGRFYGGRKRWNGGSIRGVIATSVYLSWGKNDGSDQKTLGRLKQTLPIRIISHQCTRGATVKRANLSFHEFKQRLTAKLTVSGEVALPGGKAEEGDADDAATALREAKEEIGLDSALHLLVVVPVVGILSDIEAFKPVLNADEVDSIFDVPLEMFLKDEKRTSEEREWMGQEFTIHYFNYEKGSEKYVIWGLTAGILIHTASVVFQRPPDFPEQRVQFNLPKFSRECSPMP